MSENWFDKSKWNDIGFIYLIFDGYFHKIGKAVNVEKRLKELQTSSSKELKVVWKTRSLSCAKTESYLHRRFHPKRLRTRGEWFDLLPIDVAWIQRQDGTSLDIMAASGIVCNLCGAKGMQKCKCTPAPKAPALKNRKFTYTQVRARDGTLLERCRHCGKWFKSHSEYIYCYGCTEMANELDRITKEIIDSDEWSKQ